MGRLRVGGDAYPAEEESGKSGKPNGLSLSRARQGGTTGVNIALVCYLRFLHEPPHPALKQAPRAWYARMDTYLQRLGFTKSSADPNLYIKVVEHELVIILLYVDVLLLTGVKERTLECKKQLTTKFDMQDLGSMHYYLGLEVWQEPNEIYLGQGKYVIEILKRFDMMECKPMMTPMITNLKKLRSSDSSLVDPTC